MTSVDQTPCDLYRYWDVDDRLLYVGISFHAAVRASEHRRSQGWWADVDRMTVERHPSRDSARAAELDAIRNEHPIHNIADKPDAIKTVDDATTEAYDFDASWMRLTDFHALAAAIQVIAKNCDKNDEPSRADFLHAINGIARTAIYGDYCSECADGTRIDHVYYPIKIERHETNWLRCWYVCRNRHQWTCGYTADLAVMASMP